MNHLSEQQLAEFETLLAEQKKQLEMEIKNLNGQDPYFADDRDDVDEDDDPQEDIGHDTIEAQVNELKAMLKEVNHALGKLKKGTYGVDEKTGKEIPLARLKVMPTARHNI